MTRGVPVAEAVRAAGLDGLVLYRRGHYAGSAALAATWCALPPSAKLMFWFGRWRHAHWWDVLMLVQAQTGALRLSHRNAIQPLVDAGLIMRTTGIWYVPTGRGRPSYCMTAKGRRLHQRVRLAMNARGVTG